MRRKRLVLLCLVLSPLLLVLHGGARRYGSALASRALGPTVEAEQAGSARYSSRGDALLIVPAATPSAAAAFDAVDWSWAWDSVLRRTVGPHAVVPAGQVDDTGLQGRRLIVVTSGVTASIDLRSWVVAGGILIVEAPAVGTALGGVTVSGPPLDAHTISGIEAGVLPAESCRRMVGMPVHTRRWPVRVAADARPLVRLDGEAAGWVTSVGRGAVVVVGFDMGAALVAWQQGLPGADFQVTERYGCLPFIIESDDLVMDRRMLANDVPCADLLVRAIMSTACDAGRIVGPWPIPEGAPAALIVTHDDEAQGRAAIQPLLDDDRRRGLSPTVFVVGTGPQAEEWNASEADLGIHWNRHFFSDGRRHTLLEQVEGRPQAAFNRTHYLDWGADWDGPFRALAAASMQGDCSLGPNSGWGYLFGSGLPYGVLDRRGLPLGVTEVPFEFQEDWGGGGAARMLALLDEAVARDHTAIVTLTHGDRWMATAAGRKAFDVLAARAHQLGVWCGSLRGLLGIGERSVHSRREGDRVVLSADGEPGRIWLRVPDSRHLRAVRGDPRARRRTLDDETVLVEVDPSSAVLEYAQR